VNFVSKATKSPQRPAKGVQKSRAGLHDVRQGQSRGVVTVGVRILVGSAIAMGPGKADLLEAIAATGSISAAARQMGMSYRRAWLLVDTMNSCFANPLVLKEKGGPDGGGAALSATGKRVLRKYRQLAETVAKGFGELLRLTNSSQA
jgi:molybdate transport system regulatory protein